MHFGIRLIILLLCYFRLDQAMSVRLGSVVRPKQTLKRYPLLSVRGLLALPLSAEEARNVDQDHSTHWAIVDGLVVPGLVSPKCIQPRTYRSDCTTTSWPAFKVITLRQKVFCLFISPEKIFKCPFDRMTLWLVFPPIYF